LFDGTDVLKALFRLPPQKQAPQTISGVCLSHPLRVFNPVFDANNDQKARHNL